MHGAIVKLYVFGSIHVQMFLDGSHLLLLCYTFRAKPSIDSTHNVETQSNNINID